MDNEKKVEKAFIKDIDEHVMEIIKDDGVYRNIKCQQPGTYNLYFNITTWPGYLAITGDMGDYVFSRVDDMFTFFRRDELKINSGYWAEKVKAESVYGGGIAKFSVEEFESSVLSHARCWLDLEEGDEIPKDMMSEIDCLIGCEDEYDCVDSIRRFSSTEIDFDDFWETSCDKLTYHYLWCCYAIVWTIQQYDAVNPGADA